MEENLGKNITRYIIFKDGKEKITEKKYFSSHSAIFERIESHSLDIVFLFKSIANIPICYAIPIVAVIDISFEIAIGLFGQTLPGSMIVIIITIIINAVVFGIAFFLRSCKKINPLNLILINI